MKNTPSTSTTITVTGLRGRKISNNQKPSVFSCLGLPQDPKGEENRLELTSEQLQNNFQKGLKSGFLTSNMAKMTPSAGQILTKNFDFRGHLSTFRAENTPKNWPFKAKNNAYTTSEHLQK